MAVRSADRYVRLVDVGKGAVLGEVWHGQLVNAVAWSPCGAKVRARGGVQIGVAPGSLLDLEN